MRMSGTDGTGFSLIEVVVALVVFTAAVLALSTSGLLAGRQIQMGRVDSRVWTAAQSQMERIKAQGYDNVTAGSATVQGYPMSWTVLGTDPKKVTLAVQVTDWRGVVVPDTFVTYLADWTP